MKKLIPILLLVFTISLNAQEPDRWRGLILNEATPSDAIKVLGNPAKDKPNEAFKLSGGVSRWLTKRQKEKIFRVLEFKFGKDEGVQKATLYFLDDKMVRIMLDLKAGEVSPNGLTNIYGVAFYPLINALDLAVFTKDYERNEGKIYPKTYPTVYDLAAISEKSFLSAMISNVPSLLGALGRSAGVPDQPGAFPGKVEYIDLISRTLENKDGASILK